MTAEIDWGKVDQLMKTNANKVGEDWWTSSEKRLMDYLLTGILSPGIAGVVMLGCGLVWAQDRGNPIVQLNRHHPIRCVRVLKIRSMVVGANLPESENKVFGGLTNREYKSQEEDPRITRVGKYLRKTSADEMAQFGNVVMGSMSIVGPRPKPDDEWNKMRADTGNPKYRKWQDNLKGGLRYGITGLDQVMQRNSGSFENSLVYDLIYAQRANMAGDLRIIWATLHPHVLFGGK